MAPNGSLTLYNNQITDHRAWRLCYVSAGPAHHRTATRSPTRAAPRSHPLSAAGRCRRSGGSNLHDNPASEEEAQQAACDVA